MYDPTSQFVAPQVGEPGPEARFREELANERADAATEPDEPKLPGDIELLLARHFRAAQFVPFV